MNLAANWKTSSNYYLLVNPKDDINHELIKRNAKGNLKSLGKEWKRKEEGHRERVNDMLSWRITTYYKFNPWV